MKIDFRDPPPAHTRIRKTIEVFFLLFTLKQCGLQSLYSFPHNVRRRCESDRNHPLVFPQKPRKRHLAQNNNVVLFCPSDNTIYCLPIPQIQNDIHPESRSCWQNFHPAC